MEYNMESSAVAYNRLSKPQYDFGGEFLRGLHIQQGYKVLDMGCGTGDLANYIASLVGASGEVVGVDPDEARIKIAQEKYRDVPNLQFFLGDGAKLPNSRRHDTHYYDLYVGIFVLHWLNDEERRSFMEKASGCLKPGGRLALTIVNTPLFDTPFIGCKYTSEDVYVEMCEECGLRPLEMKSVPFAASFSNYDEYKAWFHASNGRTLESCEPDWLCRYQAETISIMADGKVKYQFDGVLKIIAEKN